ncbi:unannotated protein [freshwater metagenome]|uniref:Unannotated protein n=1 Tax=freshwater metagenome TaxID=449393 RepID=A0A6J6ERL5_9ZZZZ
MIEELGRQPTISPVRAITTKTTMFKVASPRVRPRITAERAIGNERNRSIKPLVISIAKPTEVVAKVNATV